MRKLEIDWTQLELDWGVGSYEMIRYLDLETGKVVLVRGRLWRAIDADERRIVSCGMRYLKSSIR